MPPAAYTMEKSTWVWICYDIIITYVARFYKSIYHYILDVTFGNSKKLISEKGKKEERDKERLRLRLRLNVFHSS